jgi:hypothetical protein
VYVPTVNKGSVVVKSPKVGLSVEQKTKMCISESCQKMQGKIILANLKKANLNGIYIKETVPVLKFRNMFVQDE